MTYNTQIYTYYTQSGIYLLNNLIFKLNEYQEKLILYIYEAASDSHDASNYKLSSCRIHTLLQLLQLTKTNIILSLQGNFSSNSHQRTTVLNNVVKRHLPD